MRARSRPRRLGLHPLLDPAPALGVGDVHELDADRAAVPAAGRSAVAGSAPRAGLRLRAQPVHRVEVGLQEAEPAVGIQSLLVETPGVAAGA